MNTAVLRIATRKSRLALWQARYVAKRLQEIWPDLRVELVTFTTRGDEERTKPLPDIGGKGLFTAELEAALRSGEVDLAVHSLKDLPTDLDADLTIGAILEREDPRDVLISRQDLPLDRLPPNPTIGTSSTRRAAQIRLARPDARILPLRGNVDTRIRKALDPQGPYDAIVLARAGVVRLGREEVITQVLPFEVMLPAPGQGALAVQCRADDERVLALLAPLHDPETAAEVTAERAFLQALGGGCALPVAALGRVREGRLTLTALYVAPDGSPYRVQGQASMDDAEALGRELAERVKRGGGRWAVRSGQSAVGAGQATVGSGLSAVSGRRATEHDGRGNSAPRTADRGLRVLILRPREGAQEWADHLRQAGHEPVLYPTIRVAPPEEWGSLDRALHRMSQGDYHWLVLTSANGVRFVWDRLQALGLQVPAQTRIAVIGPATARALRAQGREPDLIPPAYVAEALADALGDVRGLRILLARADRARPALREILQDRGAQVDEVAAYRTLVAPPETPPPPVDVVVFSSPSTVQGFVQALRGRPFPENTRVVCIGPITAQAAREAGLPVHAVARKYTLEGILEVVGSSQSAARSGQSAGSHR